MKNKFLFVLAFLTLGLGGLYAQAMESDTLVVCDKNTSPIHLEAIVEKDLTGGSGTWNEVDPNDDSIVIAGNINDVVVAIDRQPGTYTFIYTAKNNYCLPDGDSIKAVLIIVENPLARNVVIPLCTGAAPTVDLNTYLISGLSGLTVNFFEPDGTPIANPGSYSIAADFEGPIDLSYKIVDADYLCDTMSYLTLSVRRDVVVDSLPSAVTKSYCVNSVPNDPLNLNTLLGIYMEGTWAQTSMTGFGTPAPALSGSMVDMHGEPLDVTSFPATVVYTFTPASSLSCYSGYTPTVTLEVTDDLSTNFGDGISTQVCKSFTPDGYIVLMDLLNIDVPDFSGNWRMIGEQSPVDIQDGVFEYLDARSGRYVFEYYFTNAIDLCGLSEGRDTVTIDVFDLSDAQDGQAQACIGSSETINLNDWIVGLPSTGVKWYPGMDATGTEIAGGTLDLSTLDKGTHAYSYAYPAGPCGDASGTFYLTLADMFTNFKDKEVSYCQTDEGTDAINLNTILGVIVPGTWTSTIGAPNFDATTGIFDGRAQGAGTYEFKFTVDPNFDGCIEGSEEATITVIITGDYTL